MDITTTDVSKEIELFLQTFETSDPAEQKAAGMIINYIIRQLNNESLRGHLYYHQYRTLVLNSVRGLFKLIYLDFLDLTPDSERMHRLMRADVVFASAMNFMLMLFTRVFEGKDRQLIIHEIESRRPIMLSNQSNK